LAPNSSLHETKGKKRMMRQQIYPASWQVDYESRASERLPINLRATLRVGEGRDLSVRVRDVSVTGFMAESDEYVEIGSTVMTGAGLPALGAEVRWALAGWIGCRFEKALTPDQLLQLLSQECAPQARSANDAGAATAVGFP
jgi:hypothetical protein